MDKSKRYKIKVIYVIKCNNTYPFDLADTISVL